MIVFHFFHREQKVSPKLPFSHPRTLTPTKTRRPVQIGADRDAIGSLSFLLQQAHFFFFLLLGLECSSDRHSRCNTPLWSIEKGGGVLFSVHKDRSLGGSDAFHTVCHWKLGIITGRHACSANTKKHWYYYYYCTIYCSSLVAESLLWITLVFLLFFSVNTAV